MLNSLLHTVAQAIDPEAWASDSDVLKDASIEKARDVLGAIRKPGGMALAEGMEEFVTFVGWYDRASEDAKPATAEMAVASIWARIVDHATGRNDG
jgi:hypothetical protein